MRSRGDLLLALALVLTSIPMCSAGTRKSQDTKLPSNSAWDYATQVTDASAEAFALRYPGLLNKQNIPEAWVQPRLLTEWKLRLLLEKALRGEEIIIGAVGGSITQGAGGVGVNMTYVSHVGRSLQAAFPAAKFTVHTGTVLTNDAFSASLRSLTPCH